MATLRQTIVLGTLTVNGTLKQNTSGRIPLIYVTTSSSNAYRLSAIGQGIDFYYHHGNEDNLAYINFWVAN